MKRTCRALKQGFDGVKVREVGELFEYAGPAAFWFEEIATESEMKKPEPEEVSEAEKKSKKDKKSTGDKEVI